MRRPLLVLWGLAALAASAHAQTVSRRVEAAPDGYVRFAFAARADVCGHGNDWSRHDGDEHWNPTLSCANGPILVQLTKDAGDIVHARSYVGGTWRSGGGSVTDLGAVSAPEAAAFLLALVRSDPVGHRAIQPAMLADSVEVWPELLDLARDESLSRRVNKEAMQWLGITAGRYFDDDEYEDGDSESRRRALFSVSQLPSDDGVPRLIEILQTHRYDYMRRMAAFWLGQSGDRRALPVIEELLRARS